MPALDPWQILTYMNRFSVISPLGTSWHHPPQITDLLRNTSPPLIHYIFMPIKPAKACNSNHVIPHLRLNEEQPQLPSRGTASSQWPTFSALLLTLSYLPNFLIKQSVSAFLLCLWPVQLALQRMKWALPGSYHLHLKGVSSLLLDTGFISWSANVTATSSLLLHPPGLTRTLVVLSSTWLLSV